MPRKDQDSFKPEDVFVGGGAKRKAKPGSLRPGGLGFRENQVGRAGASCRKSLVIGGVSVGANKPTISRNEISQLAEGVDHHKNRVVPCRWSARNGTLRMRSEKACTELPTSGSMGNVVPDSQGPPITFLVAAIAE
ncbi:hypothetical protein ENH_00082380 [Eimeria necatrix]|uniref:Uncharacterized protein n=1 Tax=Eimeria necatrix TaxID=51315 RepID=U6N6J6_9EIME|nr:hypothetical protein ENH_00082380 [Eimeria necatrix]CDJ70320.1 hypothetical protein ENH_00082380 [Eimeria necatrix]